LKLMPNYFIVDINKKRSDWHIQVLQGLCELYSIRLK